MNIATLIHTNQVFSWAVQLAGFFLVLLVLRWYLVTMRQQRQTVEARQFAPGPLERTVSTLIPAVGVTVVLFLLLSFFPSVLILSILFVLGLGTGGYWLVWRRKAP